MHHQKPQHGYDGRRRKWRVMCMGGEGGQKITNESAARHHLTPPTPFPPLMDILRINQSAISSY